MSIIMLGHHSIAFPLALLPSFVEWVVKILAVVGGAAVGGLLINFLVRRLGKWTGVKAVPRPVLLLFRGMGAVAGGWMVWSMVSAPGGSGLFGGGGSIFGDKGQGGGAPAETTITTSLSTNPEIVSRPAPPARITLLGGNRVLNERFYLVEGDKEAHTLGELKDILIRQTPSAEKREIVLLIYDNSVASNHAAVRDLERWIEQNQWQVSKQSVKGDLP